jgi:hypothetical protein
VDATVFETERTPYGFRIRVRGTPTLDEMAILARRVEGLVAQMAAPFSVVLDCRGFSPTSPETESAWLSTTDVLDKAGRERTAGIVSKATTKRQLDRYIIERDKGRTHRIILCCHEHWDSCACLETAELWASDGIEPEEEAQAEQ